MKHRREATVTHLIHGIKHGDAILLPSQGFSPYKIPNLVANILGVAVGMAGLYIALRDGKLGGFRVRWTLEQSRTSEVVLYVAGLQNLGNNCFLNVILQAWANCSSFNLFLQNILLADEAGIEAKAERMPLTVSLTSLLEELCIIRDKRTVLSPRRVMSALSLYVSNFNLTGQQDAAEALLHLLSSLEEELSQCYVLHATSVGDISAFPSRIYMPKREGRNECERWQQYFFGPFRGTIGSLLSCRSCSSMLCMDSEFFHCLPLSPVLDKNADIMDDCTVVDCLKHYTATDLVENYRCGRCWHMAALRYLHLKKDKDERKIKLLGECVKLDSCDCKNLFLPEEITWTGFSHAVKQLSITRCPKILCLHLQRASMNVHGDLIKLQGHISFPLTLDLFPFMEAAKTVGQETLDGMQKQMRKKHPLALQPSCSIMPWEVPMLPPIYRIVGESTAAEAFSMHKSRRSIFAPLADPSVENINEDYHGEIAAGSEIIASDLNGPQAYSIYKPQCMKKEQKTGSSCSSECFMYCLSSVIEHYGRPGSGHYAVYRRVASEPDSSDPVGVLDNHRWLYISDHQVASVSEETVVAAEASLLFYERIEAPF